MSQYAVPSACHRPVKFGFPSGIRGIRGAAAGVAAWPLFCAWIDMTRNNVATVIEITIKTFNRSDMNQVPQKMKGSPPFWQIVIELDGSVQLRNAAGPQVRAGRRALSCHSAATGSMLQRIQKPQETQDGRCDSSF